MAAALESLPNPSARGWSVGWRFGRCGWWWFGFTLFYRWLALGVGFGRSAFAAVSFIGSSAFAVVSFILSYFGAIPGSPAGV